MKKIISLLLSLCLVISALAACGSGEQSLTTENNQTNTTDIQNEFNNIENTAPETEAIKAQTEIPESVLFDSNGITVTVRGIDNGSIWGKEIKLLVENATEKNIALSGDSFIVNGIAMYGSLYIEVAAGKKANGTLTLMTSDLEVAGIEDIVTVVAYETYVVDTDNYETICHVPLDIVTTSEYQQVIDDSGDVVFEENGIKVVAKTIGNDLFGKTVKLFVSNNSGSDIYAQAENVSVNGFTLSAWMYDVIPDGTVRYCDLGIYESELEENEIEDIEDITFTFSAINVSTFSTIAKSGEIQVFVTE